MIRSEQKKGTGTRVSSCLRSGMHRLAGKGPRLPLTAPKLQHVNLFLAGDVSGTRDSGSSQLSHHGLGAGAGSGPGTFDFCVGFRFFGFCKINPCGEFPYGQFCSIISFSALAPKIIIYVGERAETFRKFFDPPPPTSP